MKEANVSTTGNWLLTVDPFFGAPGQPVFVLDGGDLERWLSKETGRYVSLAGDLDLLRGMYEWCDCVTDDNGADEERAREWLARQTECYDLEALMRVLWKDGKLVTAMYLVLVAR